MMPSTETEELLRKGRALAAEASSCAGYEADALESLAVSAVACATMSEKGGGVSASHYATFALMEASVHATLHLAHMVEEVGRTIGSAPR